MKHFTVLLFVAVSLLMGQTKSPCDINDDGRIDQTDVTKAVTAVAHNKPCKPDGSMGAVCNVIAVQRILNAAKSKDHACHAVLFVSVKWNAAPGTKYYVYRKSDGKKVHPDALASGSTFDELPVGSKLPGYEVRAVGKDGKESPPQAATAK